MAKKIRPKLDFFRGTLFNPSIFFVRLTRGDVPLQARLPVNLGFVFRSS